MIEKEVTYFAQSHQSYLVNMRYVTRYDRLSVILSYGGKLEWNYDQNAKIFRTTVVISSEQTKTEVR